MVISRRAPSLGTLSELVVHRLRHELFETGVVVAAQALRADLILDKASVKVARVGQTSFMIVEVAGVAGVDQGGASRGWWRVVEGGKDGGGWWRVVLLVGSAMGRRLVGVARGGGGAKNF